MSVQLVNPLPDNDINVSDLPEGKIAVITKWHGESGHQYCGDIVQRWDDHLIAVGDNRNNSWPQWYENDERHPSGDRNKCWLLPKGTLLAVNV